MKGKGEEQIVDNMIVDLNNMPQMFWECNQLYFNHQLQTPKFGLMHSYRTLGKFAYRWGEKKMPVKKAPHGDSDVRLLRLRRRDIHEHYGS